MNINQVIDQEAETSDIVYFSYSSTTFAEHAWERVERSSISGAENRGAEFAEENNIAEEQDETSGSIFLCANIEDAKPSNKSAVPLQQWLGNITEVGESSFQARLVDICKQEPDAEAVIPIEYVADGDRDLVKIGASFYWNFVLENNRGKKAVVNTLRFRRLPSFHDFDKRAIARFEDELSSWLEI